LRVGLAQNNLNLTGSGPDWVLQRGGAALRESPAPLPSAPANLPPNSLPGQ
jgi:hypothetical protein